MIREREFIQVVKRRRFESGLRRHFVGEVAATGNPIRARGYVFILNSSTGLFDRKPDLRTRLFSASDANNVINILVENVDGRDLRLDVNEFGSAR